MPLPSQLLKGIFSYAPEKNTPSVYDLLQNRKNYWLSKISLVDLVQEGRMPTWEVLVALQKEDKGECKIEDLGR